MTITMDITMNIITMLPFMDTIINNITRLIILPHSCYHYYHIDNITTTMDITILQLIIVNVYYHHNIAMYVTNNYHITINGFYHINDITITMDITI